MPAAQQYSVEGAVRRSDSGSDLGCPMVSETPAGALRQPCGGADMALGYLGPQTSHAARADPIFHGCHTQLYCNAAAHCWYK